MDFSTLSQAVSTKVASDINIDNTAILTVAESANIMRTMLSSIDLEQLTHEYFELMCARLPCNAITLSFADKVLEKGRAKTNARTLTISIYYGHPFGTPQTAKLAYSFLRLLTPVQRKLLSEMHTIYAMGLRHALEYYRISQLATKDMLTGLGNRVSYNDSICKLISISKRNDESFGLLVFDLDNFKQVNDRYGHQEGDDVLVSFGQILLSCLRDSDHAFRFGGDEFCCLLINSDAKANKRVARRITKAIAQNPLFIKHGVSSSVGATSFVLTDDAKSLFERADNALYQAKEAGKNRFVAI